ncbi:hypothetical protein EDD86DRAFT_216399 [Gorgonomyces haynaldii]|nr:hypothetical protein EDD86DRAFT_216399 [Gorgonomyces haynaldii]
MTTRDKRTSSAISSMISLLVGTVLAQSYGYTQQQAPVAQQGTYSQQPAPVPGQEQDIFVDCDDNGNPIITTALPTAVPTIAPAAEASSYGSYGSQTASPSPSESLPVQGYPEVSPAQGGYSAGATTGPIISDAQSYSFVAALVGAVVMQL